jgi:hypothetical protein
VQTNLFQTFISTFSQSIKSDSTVSQALNQTLEDFRRTFEVTSATQFLQMAVVDLLDLVEDLVIGAFAIVKAFISGFLSVAADFVTLVAGDGGLITGTLNIPIVSSLYKTITGDDLSFLDLCLLVAAIPITIIYRLVEGKYFADEYSAGDAAPGGAQAAATPQPVLRAFGLLTGITYFSRASWVESTH